MIIFFISIRLNHNSFLAFRSDNLEWNSLQTRFIHNTILSFETPFFYNRSSPKNSANFAGSLGTLLTKRWSKAMSGWESIDKPIFRCFENHIVTFRSATRHENLDRLISTRTRFTWEL